ncbi:hypothetical protein QJS10_CPA01g01497 [Acorus calamus]|uniref:Uncharacterized protein n=1 Tax=Acorus calamus TaxID=4465 RepID=A0AAV9FIZ2_ACOCL|nr:hypothetical protein QJS10_CPA01g01497 [Acorus calamus]
MNLRWSLNKIDQWKVFNVYTTPIGADFVFSGPFLPVVGDNEVMEYVIPSDGA